MIAKLIEAMDFIQFREFARQCIAQRGYKPVPCDGWSDGGRDISVYATEGRISRQIAFQSSVEWEWESKLWEDLIKAKTKLGCVDFIYVTNRRIGGAVFDPVVQRALTEEEVHLGKIDNQELAAQVVDRGNVGWFTKFIGISAGEPTPNMASLRTEAADAFVLFSDSANDFRDRIAEHCIMVALLRRGPLSERDLLNSAGEIMDFRDDNRLRAAVDRLQQSGEIVRDKRPFELSRDMAEHYRSTHELVSADRRAYQEALRKRLASFLPRGVSVDSAVAQVEEFLGTLVRRYADYQVALLQDSAKAHDIRENYVAQIHRIESAMHGAGVPYPRLRECIEKVNTVVEEHPVVTRLVAGDVFRRLVSCDKGTLLNAMGRARGIKAFLEPTVVIPLLCYKLFVDAAGNRHLRAARWLFERASALGISFVVPDVYVEECASHLLEAGRYVNPLLRAPVEEFAYSENAFVAFYSALKMQEARVPDYKDFLELFGFVVGGDFDGRLARVAATIKRTLRTFDLTVENVSRYRCDARVRRVAEDDLSYIYKQRAIDKPRILIGHDTQVLAYMRDKADRGQDSILLATWDQTLQEACRMDDYDWWCMDPLHAGDLMALVEPGGRGSLGVDVALLFDDAHLKMAAAIWDQIVRIEKDNMYDSEVMRTAIKFKKEHLARQTSDAIAASRIANSWRNARETALAAEKKEPANG